MNIGKRAQPAAEEKRGGDGGNHNHVGVFAEGIESPAEAAVFGPVARNEYGPCFGKVGGSTVGFGERGDYIGEESHGGQENEPDMVIRLGIDNAMNPESPGEEQGADDGEAADNFEADELGGTAYGAGDRVMAGGGPAAEDDAEKAERTDTNDEKDADVDVSCNTEGRTEVKRAHGGERGDH